MKVTDVKRNSCLLYNLTKCTVCSQRVASTGLMFVRFRSHYEVLGLSRNASQKEIRDAYIQLSKKFHPDSNQQDKNSHAKFVKVQEAYEILSKESSKSDYDSNLFRIHQPVKSYPTNRSSQRPPNYYSSGQNFTDNNYYDPYSKRRREDPFSFYASRENQQKGSADKEESKQGFVGWWNQLFTKTDLVFQAIGALLVTMMVVMLFQIGWEYKIAANLKDSIEKIKKEQERREEMKKNKKLDAESKTLNVGSKSLNVGSKTSNVENKGLNVENESFGVENKSLDVESNNLNNIEYSTNLNVESNLGLAQVKGS